MPLFPRKRTKNTPLDEAHIRQLVADAPVASAVLDSEGQVLAANAVLQRLIGRDEAALRSFGLFERLYRADAEEFARRFDEMMAGNHEHLRMKQRWVRQNGEVLWCQATAHRIRVGRDRRSLALLMLEDVTEHIQIEQERWDNEAQLSIQRNVTNALARAASADEALTSLLQAVCEANGWAIGLFWAVEAEKDRLVCTHYWHAASVESQLFVASIRKRPLTRQGGPPADAWSQGMPIWVEDVAEANRSIHVAKAQDAGLSSAVCIPVLLPAGVYGVLEFMSWERREERSAISRGMVAVSRQAAAALERIWAEFPLREREARYRAIAEMSGEAIITIDADSTIEFVNAAAERIFGYSQSEMVGQSLTMLMPEGLRAAHLAGMKRVMQTSRHRIQWDELEMPGLTKGGTEILLQMSLADTGTPDKRAFTGFMRDITEQKREESALVYQALHDALTDLPNRTLLQERLARAVLVAHRHSTPLSLLFMDLDRFKDVNDSCGHHSGDILLQQVAQRLQRALRESDTVARLGGDEFAVLLPMTEERGAIQTAQRLIESLKEPFTVEGQPLEIGTSIGIAYYPEHGGDAGTLMRRADVAMYAAKRASGGFAIYTADRDELSSLRLLLTGELRQAIDSNQLVLHYQPKVNLRDGRTENVEALIRWNHPERGMQAPDGFIPLAEETGLMKPLTVWVLNEALRQHCVWREQGIELRMAVNFSARVLHDPELIGIVTTALEAWNVEPSWLEVEITESAIMIDPERAMETLTALHVAGIFTSIDDFGTGLSSFAYLKQLPVDELKIDKSFVMEMATNRDDRTIVESIIALGHNFELQVVAEGVDNQRTLDTLGKMGCDMVQGYYLSRPVAPDDLVRWLQDPKHRLATAS